jgi:ADP-heptose:LPS heptosyltransferase
MTRGPAALDRILLVQLHHLGDVVLSTPAIRAVRRALPRAVLDFLAARPGADALRGNPHLDHVHVLRRRWAADRALAGALRNARYDAVVDFHSTPRTALLVAATRAPIRVGVVGRGPRNLAYTQLVSRVREPVYMAKQKLRLLAPLGIEPDPDDLDLEVFPSADDRAWAADAFERHGLGGGVRVVAISPVSRIGLKQWGAGPWAAVADRLVEEGFRVVLTNGPGELDQVRDMVARMTRPAAWDLGVDRVGRLAALYEQCGVWLGNDGGAKHIAVGVGVPTVTVARPGLGAVWTDTRGGSAHRVFDPPAPAICARGCERCRGAGCIGDVGVAEVVEAALLAARRAHRTTGTLASDS